MSEPPRPTVTLKLATSLDGKIALGDGRSKWITGPEAREAVHHMRAAHDAVLTGVGTVLADDPQMTARPGGAPSEHQPLRAVMDSRLRTPADCALLKAGPATLFHAKTDTDAQALSSNGARLVAVETDGAGRASLTAALRALFEDGVRSLMIEAGGTLAGAAVREGLVDRIEWFRAPTLIGGDGRPCVAALGLESLGAAPIFTRVSVREAGADLWETYERG
ncbi:MAG: RibD family protein [Oceanicaulis sp.]